MVEGDSSLTAHSVFANNLLQKLVDQDADLELRGTLETLRHLVDAMKKQPAAYEMTYPNVKAGSLSASEAFRQCELPPIQQTVQMLNLAKGTSTRFDRAVSLPSLIFPSSSSRTSPARLIRFVYCRWACYSQSLDMRCLSPPHPSRKMYERVFLQHILGGRIYHRECRSFGPVLRFWSVPPIGGDKGI